MSGNALGNLSKSICVSVFIPFKGFFKALPVSFKALIISLPAFNVPPYVPLKTAAGIDWNRFIDAALTSVKYHIKAACLNKPNS